MKKYIILLSFVVLSLTLYPFDTSKNPVLPAGVYNIYYTYTVPAEVLPIIQAAMNEVSPRQYINSANVPVLGTIEADPINSINNPDTLTQTVEFSLPDEYKDNGRINIHWGKLLTSAQDDPLGQCDPNLTPPDIVIDSIKYSNLSIDLATILKHEILHAIGISHTTATFDGNPASDKIMYASIASYGPEKFMSQDEINGLNELYNRHYFISPTPAQPGLDLINVIANDSIKFMAKRAVAITNLLNPYDIDYEWVGVLTDSVKMRTDSVLYKFNSGPVLGTKNMKSYIEGDQIRSIHEETTRNFEMFAPNLYTPKADTSIVAEIGRYLPVKLKIKDDLDNLLEFSNIYNADSMKVKFKLWYDGWLSNDTISTTATLNPTEEFKWYFSNDGANNTINLNHSDFKFNSDYQITARLYVEEDNVLNFIGEVNSEEFILREGIEIPSPLPGEIKYVRTRDKGAVADSILIKVKVPEILGAYPEINIKIDGVYVNQGDIFFDTTDSLWTYDWDLSTVTPTVYGKKYIITAEIDGDPTDRAVSSLYLTEAIYYEDFQTITSLATAGWYLSSWENPEIPYVGWWLDVDALDNENKCVVSQTQHSLSVSYTIRSPGITIPVETGRTTIVSYNVFYAELEPDPPFSYLYFYITDAAGSALTPVTKIISTKDQWVNFTYDVSQFSGQTIKLKWHNYYQSSVKCKYTAYCVDDVLVYSIPDTEGPRIDYISGTNAELNENMNLNLGFNDASGIEEVTADYSIDGSSGSLTLTPTKTNFNYAGTISAKDHECSGTITFKIRDSIGNETISSPYSICWAEEFPILSVPENVVITALNDSTESITWDLVVGATSYKVYSSTDPYGTFTEDTTGSFTESRKWEKIIDGNKYFYYVIAVNALKKEDSLFEEADFSDR